MSAVLCDKPEHAGMPTIECENVRPAPSIRRSSIVEFLAMTLLKAIAGAYILGFALLGTALLFGVVVPIVRAVIGR